MARWCAAQLWHIAVAAAAKEDEQHAGLKDGCREMLLLLLIYEILVDLALPIAALPGNEAYCAAHSRGCFVVLNRG